MFLSIRVACLGHHTLCMENLVWFQYPRIHFNMYHSIKKNTKPPPPQKKKTQTNKQNTRHRTDFEPDLLPETEDVFGRP